MIFEATPVQRPIVSTATKVAFLKQPSSHPDSPQEIETVETHFAWVFLGDRFAYKLKKPVCFDSMDFSTLDSRWRDCRAELELNRRLTSDVYLDVVPLTIDASGALHLEGEDEPIEWLVKMRRLPSERMLDRAIESGKVNEDEVRCVGHHLAAFYRSAEPVKMRRAQYRRRLERQTHRYCGELRLSEYRLPGDLIVSIRDDQIGFVKRHARLFDERVSQNRIIEAHGDLRPEHICLGPEIQIIDCLQFDRDLRILDVAEELCFLHLECERAGAAWIGQLIVASYGSISGDQPAPELMQYYRSTRALTRAVVAARHVLDPEIQQPEHWISKARQYLEIAADSIASTS